MSGVYRDAGRALQLVIDGRSGAKGAVFKVEPANIRHTYAVVVEAAKHLADLQAIATACINEAALPPGTTRGVLFAVLHDHLWGAGVQGGGALKRLVVSLDSELRAASARLGIALGRKAAAASAGAPPPPGPPRYLRVNTLVSSVPAVVAELTGAGASAAGSGPHLSPADVVVDEHVPYVLRLLPPDAHRRLALHSHPLVVGRPGAAGGGARAGRGGAAAGGQPAAVILQDKSSCFTAHALLWDLLPPSLRASGSDAAASGATERGGGKASRKRRRAAAVTSGPTALHSDAPAPTAAEAAGRFVASTAAAPTPAVLIPAGYELFFGGTGMHGALSPSSTVLAPDGRSRIRLAFPGAPVFVRRDGTELLQLLPIDDGTGAGGFDGLDACAAPGNKTTQLAALLAAVHLPPPQPQQQPLAGDRESAANEATAAAAAAWGEAAAAGTTAQMSPAAAAQAAALEAQRRERKQARRAARRAEQERAFYGVGAGLGPSPAGDADLPSSAPALRQACSDGSISGARVFAFDKSRERAAVLQSRVDAAGCGRFVTVTCADVVAADLGADAALGRVRVAVVDPSCSGSGMAAHGGAADAEGAGVAAASAAAAGAGGPPPEPPEAEAARVASLATFQRTVLLHVLRSLPRLARAAYSTCSVWGTEDEGVVAGVLAAWEAEGHALEEPPQPPAGDGSGRRVPLRLVLLPAMPEWRRRGLAGGGFLGVDEAAACLRAFPAADATGGFFVAVLHKAAVLWKAAGGA